MSEFRQYPNNAALTLATKFSLFAHQNGTILEGANNALLTVLNVARDEVIQNTAPNSIDWEKLSRAIYQCIMENIKHAERKPLVAKLQRVAAAIENAKIALLGEVDVKCQIQSVVTDIEQLFLMQPNSIVPHCVHSSGS